MNPLSGPFAPVLARPRSTTVNRENYFVMMNSAISRAKSDGVRADNHDHGIISAMERLLRSGFSKEQLQEFERLTSSASEKNIPDTYPSVATQNSLIINNGHLPARHDGDEGFRVHDGVQSKTQLPDIPAMNGVAVQDQNLTQSPLMPVAVIGMSCRFPGDASDLGKLWDLCSKGRSAWSEVPPEKFNIDAFYHPDPERGDSMNTKAGHFLKDEDFSSFDASFFNISPNEAKAMDPRQRMHLEGAYEALENAGITMSQIAETLTSVFVGFFNNDYGEVSSRDPQDQPFYRALGLGASLFANRISYFFDLKGPSVVVDTACSASLTAMLLACESLRSGESKLSIVSGANIILTPDTMTMLSTLRFLSPDGKTYMFDERANGYSRGEGIGTLILKPLQDALQDGDPIHAVIRNISSNQDGKTPGITVPSQGAQESLITQTYSQAGIDPAETDFFEAHGTGTQAGDVIEAGAISTAFRSASRLDSRPLYVGSIKTQIGHCEAASGMAGVFHAILALKHGYILPNCNFEICNEKIPLENWKLKVPTKLEQWTSKHTRRASVNSFGYGGTNVHAILEEPPYQASFRRDFDATTDGTNTNHTSQYQQPKILCISAHDESGVQEIARNLAGYLESHKHSDGDKLLNDLIFTLGEHRSSLLWRAAYRVSSTREVTELLTNTQIKPSRVTRTPKLGFIFTGQGAQWSGMSKELLEVYPVYRNTLETANRHLINLGASWSLIDELCRDAKTSKINEAYLSQPLCTAVQIALVRLLRSWAIEPKSVVGHSSGEIAAAYCAGTLSLESAMTVAYYRGKYSSNIKLKAPDFQGGMLAVGLSPQDCEDYISDVKSGKLNIACVNSPASVTVSGDLLAIDELQSKLKQSETFNRKLKVDIAYHSHHMEVLAEEYLDSIRHIGTSAPSETVSFFSSVFPGVPVGSVPEYWVQNMLRPVRFVDAVRNMSRPVSIADTSETGIDVLVEIGPHSALAGPIKQIHQLPSFSNSKPTYFASLQRNSNATQSVMELACNLYSKGFKLEFGGVNFPSGNPSAKILTDLPPYPWNHRTKHWHEGRLSRNYRHRKFPRHDFLGSLNDDSTELELKWKNFFRLSQLPWLRHHMVRSNIIYPGAGYVAMAIEAARQKRALFDEDFQGCTLREIGFSKALVIPDTADGVEISFVLRPYRQSAVNVSGKWDEFSVFSHSSDRGATEHCHGLIGTHTNFTTHASDLIQSIAEAERYCVMPLDLAKVWAQMSSIGLELGPSFSNIRSCRTGRDQALCNLDIADTATMMPYQFEYPCVISPATLDSFFQCSIIASAQGVSDFSAPIMPTYVKEIVISNATNNIAGQKFIAHADIKKPGARTLEGNVRVTNDPAGSPEPIVQISGLKFSLLSKEDSIPKDDANSKLCWNVLWKHDIDDLTRTNMDKLWPIPEVSSAEVIAVKDIERVTWHCIQRAIESLTDDDYSRMEPFHQTYYNWMKKKYELGKNGNLPYQTPEWLGASEHDIDSLLEMTSAASTHGRMTVRIGRRLVEILQKKVDSLSLMLQDGLLHKFYESISGQNRVYLQAARYVDLVAHKTPTLNILEIGAGTGSITSWILDVLGGSNGNYPRFSQYCFTDISPGFFEKANEKFKDWAALMQFKKLNIEEDVIAQGFEHETYDVIIAANVLHATHKMDHTMGNVRRLLKPGGKLVLVEVTGADHAVSGPFVFGTLSGWWMGVEEGRIDGPCLTEEEWNSLLLRNSFTGLDACIRDSADENSFSTSMMVSTKTQESPEMIHENIMILHSELSGGPSIDSLILESQTLFGKRASVAQLEEIEDRPLLKGIYVFLDQAKGSILLDLNSKQFDALKQVIASAEGILWITFGGLAESEAPAAGAVTGFLRTMRSENYGTMMVTLDLDIRSTLSSEGTVKKISKVLRTSFQNPAQISSVSELEYLERQGQLFIPRIVEDKSANNFVVSQSQTEEPELLSFGQIDNPLRLDMGHLGLLDTFRFISDFEDEQPLGHDQVRIAVKATGLNFHDLMVATGQIDDTAGYGMECAGVVSKVGNDVKDLQPGDRVCAISPSTLGTYSRAHQSLTIRIPEDMTFEVAASIPNVFSTAHYSLYQAARLQKGESILIHSAAGGLGQASIQIAQRIGARIFVTVGTPSKAEFLSHKYGIPRDHILNSRDLSFAPKVMRLTRGKGVDVVINSLAGESLRETWNCIGMFGRFVELGKRDILENTRLDMAPFEMCVSFITVGMDVLGAHRRESVAKAFEDVFSLFRAGALTPVEPITSYSMSQVEQAFRFMATGKHMGKIVVTTDPNDNVLVVPKPTEKSLLRPKSSYLIIGLEGIGGALAEWMVQQLAAKNLILMSRSGDDTPGAKKLTDRLREADAEITVIKCDVGDTSEVNRVLAQCVETMPPIRGVIHGGMVLRDAIFPNMSLEEYAGALRAKIPGSLNLHNYFTSINQELDFFIMLSSLAGIMGNTSQANYATGNTFQDALAHHRASNGLAATAIDLGNVLDIGWVARNRKRVAADVLETAKDISLPNLIALIKHSILNHKPQSRKEYDVNFTLQHQIVFGIEGFPKADAKFSHVNNVFPKSSSAQKSSSDQESLQSLIAQAPPNSSVETLSGIIWIAVQQKLSRLLSLPKEEIDEQDLLTSHGIDSLVAVEVRNWLRKEAGADISIFQILSSKGTIKQLVDQVAMQKISQREKK